MSPLVQIPVPSAAPLVIILDVSVSSSHNFSVYSDTTSFFPLQSTYSSSHHSSPHNSPPYILPPPLLVGHPMTTRSKVGIYKLKSYLLALLAQQTDLTSASQALSDPMWFKTM